MYFILLETNLYYLRQIIEITALKLFPRKNSNQIGMYIHKIKK